MAINATSLQGFSKLFASRLNSLQPLADHEREVLRGIERKHPLSYAVDTILVSQGSDVRVPRLIVAGWAAYTRQLQNGRRQIVGVMLPGDVIGLSALVQPVAPSSIVALAPLRTVELPEVAHGWRDRDRLPGITHALDLIAAEELFFLHGHAMRLGRQNAHERTANFFMELDYRLSAIGHSTNGAFRFPLTQETLADILGLSVVHVNRTLQQMRRDKQIALGRGDVALLDREALGREGEFKPPQLSISLSRQPVMRGAWGSPAHRSGESGASPAR